MMQRYTPKLEEGYILKSAVLFIVYFLTAKLGLSFYALHGFATTVWPPTGIAIAALILYGYNLWPAVTLAAFAINFSHGAGLFTAIGISIGNTLEAIAATYFLRKYVTLYRCFERLPDTLRFIGIVIAVTALGATIGAASLLVGGTVSLVEFGATWFTWWIGDALGAIVVAPFILTHFAATRPWNADKLSWWEIAGGYGLLIFSGWLIFWHPINGIKNTPLLYLILFPLIWSGIRFGSRGMTSSVFFTSIIAVLATAYGHGPFIMNPIATGLLYMQIFIGTIAITFLIFISIVKERRLVMAKLEEHVGELEHALQKISQADRAKNDFLAILAHELRNPLAPILSSLELMRIRIDENSDIATLAKTAEMHVHTMSHLLDDLLDISRISRRKLKLEKESFNMQNVIKMSLQTAEPAIAAKGHQMKVSLPEETIWLFGDPLRIEQVIVNMLINAAKYTDHGGTIELLAEKNGEWLVLSIKDSGIGIEKHMLNKVFEPFIQLNKESSFATRGLGIGLSLTRKLVELHGGTIEARSEGLGKGSEFIVNLPIPEYAQLPLQMSTSSDDLLSIPVMPTLPRQNKYRILVVDDNVAAAEGLRELLRYKGHAAESHFDGKDAVGAVRKFNPDIVILDIGLPEISGYEVAAQLREEMPPKLIIIALTGYGQEEDKIKARNAGFNHHLTKPIGISDIEKILNSL